MSTIFEDLKRAREEQHMHLSDIADRTLINVRHLEEIEQGNTAILPEVYVRAFIREYAAAVGLDPNQIMHRFDEARRPEQHPQPATERVEAPPPARPSFSLEPGRILTPRVATFAALGVIAIIAAIFLWNIIAPGSSGPVTEIPFQSVVKEHEQRVAPSEKRPAPAPAQSVDSLTLSVAITDTVWMTVAIDSLPSREYLFRPGGKATWRARTKFTLTLGNGGAAAFTLNRKSLGTLGKRGSVVRNFSINRETLAAGH